MAAQHAAGLCAHGLARRLALQASRGVAAGAAAQAGGRAAGEQRPRRQPGACMPGAARAQPRPARFEKRPRGLCAAGRLAGSRRSPDFAAPLAPHILVGVGGAAEGKRARQAGGREAGTAGTACCAHARLPARLQCACCRSPECAQPGTFLVGIRALGAGLRLPAQGRRPRRKLQF